MNRITSIFFLLIAMLSSCGQTNYPQRNPTVSEQTAAEQTSESATAATAVEARTTATVTSATVPETVKQPISTAVTVRTEQIQSAGTTMVTTAENNVIQPKTTKAVTTASTTDVSQKTTAAETIVSTETVTATTNAYEPTEEEKLIQTGKNLSHDGTDYGKAEAVYNFMRENGHGTCVGYSYQTLYICKGIGPECCYIQTPAQLYGHVANAVKIDGMWFVLDTQGECFLTENMCGFTEIVDENENFISDASIISKIRYDQLEYQ